VSRWVEVALEVDGEAAEAAAELLQRYGYQGVSIEHEGIPPDKLDEDELPPPERLVVRAYIPDDERAPQMRAQLEAALSHLNWLYPMPQPAFRVIDEQDWAEAWKAHYHPVRIGRRLLIRPQWVQMTLDPDVVEIALDPGMAFGTGTHPTTQLCLEATEAIMPPGAQVIDLGCGSGILAIGAAKLGAAHVLALDIDPIAVEATRANAAYNGVAAHITAQQGSLETVLTSARRFDFALVNILARTIIQLCDAQLGQIIRPGGLAVFSGIILEQAEDVEAALRRTGLEPYARRKWGDWVAIEARRL
jgi:ribosomal protein L11 methyltransferase